jgi:hypothetical protein
VNRNVFIARGMERYWDSERNVNTNGLLGLEWHAHCCCMAVMPGYPKAMSRSCEAVTDSRDIGCFLLDQSSVED